MECLSYERENIRVCSLCVWRIGIDGTWVLFKPRYVVSKCFQIWAGFGTYLQIRDQLAWTHSFMKLNLVLGLEIKVQAGVKTFWFRCITCYEHAVRSWSWPFNNQNVICNEWMSVTNWNAFLCLNSKRNSPMCCCWLVLQILVLGRIMFLWDSIPFCWWVALPEAWQGSLLLSVIANCMQTARDIVLADVQLSQTPSL